MESLRALRVRYRVRPRLTNVVARPDGGSGSTAAKSHPWCGEDERADPSRRDPFANGGGYVGRFLAGDSGLTAIACWPRMSRRRSANVAPLPG
jgi:hypothetical protein